MNTPPEPSSAIVVADIPVRAALPELYAAAKKALAQCAELDECKEWSDKAAAIASYARQAKDTSLRNHAMRIQARALRQLGELLERFPTLQGRRTDLLGGGVKKSPRKNVSEEAGVSERQAMTARRIANVPKESFEQQVEAANPPSMTELARQGTQRRPAPPAEPDDQIAKRGQEILAEVVAYVRMLPTQREVNAFRNQVLRAITDEALKDAPDA
jgi:hypothetical protein